MARKLKPGTVHLPPGMVPHTLTADVPSKPDDKPGIYNVPGEVAMALASDRPEMINLLVGRFRVPGATLESVVGVTDVRTLVLELLRLTRDLLKDRQDARDDLRRLLRRFNEARRLNSEVLRHVALQTHELTLEDNDPLTRMEDT